MTRPDLIAIGAYNSWDIEAMEAAYTLHHLPAIDALPRLPEALRGQVRAVAYQGHHAFGGAEMDLVPALGLIANFGVGYDAIDVEAATARGVKVTNTPGVLNDDVADLAVALLLAQGRRIVQGSDWVRSGTWAKKGEMPLNRKISGGRVGILGLGRIGREIANRLAGFKMEIHYFARTDRDITGWTFHADPVSLARAVDYLIVALVGGPATKGLVSAEVIRALGREGVIVNISRGTVIDEPALLDALENRRIAGAALDVFVSEPNIDPRFLALENVVLQPHQGSGTVATRMAMGELQRKNVAAFLAGRELPTPVN
jgi:lactate dehydrogenase-like 2-hydroxyacid dehydrogenase